MKNGIFEAARQIILNTDNVVDAAAEYVNGLEADVDKNGDVWTGTRWLDDDELIEFAGWLCGVDLHVTPFSLE